jgi:hypothetical protein
MFHVRDLIARAANAAISAAAAGGGAAAASVAAADVDKACS